ncbi:hypothetical protein PM082_000659 [Marasmius tenuissimus]|nr:hypothetical protein PM082_000659 [Marasmius tenuissimus]
MSNTNLLVVDLISYQVKALPSLMEPVQAHSHTRSYHHIITITIQKNRIIRESYPSYQHLSPHSSIDRSTPPPFSPLHEPTTPTTTTTKPIFSHPRPYFPPHSSGGDASDIQFSTPNEHEPSSSLGLALGKPDRLSSASLPLRAHIPYHTLPRAQLDGGAGAGGSLTSDSGIRKFCFAIKFWFWFRYGCGGRFRVEVTVFGRRRGRRYKREKLYDYPTTQNQELSWVGESFTCDIGGSCVGHDVDPDNSTDIDIDISIGPRPLREKVDVQLNGL